MPEIPKGVGIFPNLKETISSFRVIKTQGPGNGFFTPILFSENNGSDTLGSVNQMSRGFLSPPEAVAAHTLYDQYVKLLNEISKERREVNTEDLELQLPQNLLPLQVLETMALFGNLIKETVGIRAINQRSDKDGAAKVEESISGEYADIEEANKLETIIGPRTIGAIITHIKKYIHSRKNHMYQETIDVARISQIISSYEFGLFQASEIYLNALTIACEQSDPS